jgi:uncharacterized membrane protein SirB2
MLRAYWSVTNSGKLQLRIIKITPHVVDTILLVCGVALAVMLGSLQPWISAKIIALVLYIGVGTVAIKRGRTPRSRGVAALIAIAIFFYIVGVALAHDPMSWLA